MASVNNKSRRNTRCNANFTVWLLNQLENGLFPDLGVKKLRAILDQVGLALAI